MIKEYFNKYINEISMCIDDLKHKETFYKQVPNLLTFSRAVGSIPIGFMFLSGNVALGIISTGLLLSTDFFDGKIARKWDIQSKFGADLDAFCDKIMFLGLSLSLIINNPIILLNFVLEGAISIVNVYGRMKGLDTKTVFSGKIKTCLLSLTLIYGYLVQFLGMSVSFLNILVSMTLGGQCVAFANYVKEYIRLNKEKQENLDIDIKSNTNTVEQEVKLLDNSLDKTKNLEVSRTELDELRKEREFCLGMKIEPTNRIKVRKKYKQKEW